MTLNSPNPFQIDPTLSTITVAKRLLGSTLYRHDGKITHVGTISETEAYLGPDDLAAHSARGRTVRTEPMFGPAGTIYVYLIYGMYHCLNLITRAENEPEGVLIRGLVLTKPQLKHLIGPGKITCELNITRALSGQKLGHETGLWIKWGSELPETDIIATPRIGISAPEPWRSAPLRFVVRK